MDEAINEIKRICRDEKIIGLYNAEKVAKKEMNTRLDYAEQQGFEKGHGVGYGEGNENGKMEEKLEIASNMLKKDVDISFISEMTGLTKEQIEELK